MKIAFVTTNYPRWKNDNRAPFIHGLAQTLKQKGCNVRVVTMHNPGSKQYEIIDGIEIIRLRYAWNKAETLQSTPAGIPIEWKKNFRSKILLAVFFFHLLIRLPRLLRGVDVVHAHWTLSGLAVRLSKVFHGIPYVLTVHGSDIYQANGPLLTKINRFSLVGASHIMCVGSDLANEVTKLGLDSSKIKVISMGVNTERFSVLPLCARKNQILYVGSLIKRKAVDTLLIAFSQIPSIEYELLIVGDGPERENLLLLNDSFPGSHRVHFLGTVAPEKVIELNSYSKVFVLPSIEEGLGVVLLEALSAGTPCIASRVGGIPDAIDESVGRLVEPNCPQQIARALMELLSDGQLWQECSLAARKRAEDTFDWQVIATKTLQIYKAALQTFKHEF